MASISNISLLGSAKVRIAVIMGILILFVPGCGQSVLNTNSCATGEIGTPPNCFSAPPAPAAAGKTWHIAFSEEFNGDDYDHNKLTPCFDWNYGDCTYTFNEGKERYMPEQVRVSDGTAKLVAEPLVPPEPNDGCFEGSCTYKAGLLSTARKNAINPDNKYLFPFTYGYVESRIKYPAVPGFFTAFWMLPTDPTYEYRSEIDIAEILGGHPETIFMTYHYDNREQSYKVNSELGHNGACPARDYSQGWTTFGVDWQPDHIAWYINGVKCAEFTDPTRIENGPMQLILHMMIDNNWERDWVDEFNDPRAVLTDQTIVDQLEVDYIRVYQQQ